MSGPKRNPDKLNTIGIVVVGICGAVLVYVSIVALQAFYVDDSSEIQTMADYGGQDIAHKSIRTQQIDNLKKYEPKAAPPAPKDGEQPAPQLYTIDIHHAMSLVVASAKNKAEGPSKLVPAFGEPTPTVRPIFGRPQLLPVPGAGSATPPAPLPSEPPAGAGSAAPMTPTGGMGPGGGNPPAPEPKATEPKATPKTTEPVPKTGEPKTPKDATPKATPKAATPKAAQPKKGNAP